MVSEFLETSQVPDYFRNTLSNHFTQQNLFAKRGEPDGEGRVRIKNESDQVSYPRLSCLNCQLWLMVVLVFKMHFLGFITTKVSERRHRD